MRIKMANTIKKDKIMEFKEFYENKFEPINKNILNMIESTPKEFVPNRLKCQFQKTCNNNYHRSVQTCVRN